MAKLQTIALLKMLERIQEKDQEFYIGCVNDAEDCSPFRYKLKEIFSDGKAYFLHVHGIHVSDGYQQPRGTITMDERLVNLAHVVAIRPIAIK
jgi:hypothetical protein